MKNTTFLRNQKTPIPFVSNGFRSFCFYQLSKTGLYHNLSVNQRESIVFFPWKTTEIFYLLPQNFVLNGKSPNRLDNWGNLVYNQVTVVECEKGGTLWRLLMLEFVK